MTSGKRMAAYLLAGAFCLCVFSVVEGAEQVATQNSGEAGFREYCAACHADGGNIINPDKTLSKKDRERNGVKTAKDIIKIMRNPGGEMTMFDEETLPENEAEKIAEYIITTFK
jgi:cytochrome c6